MRMKQQWFNKLRIVRVSTLFNSLNVRKVHSSASERHQNTYTRAFQQNPKSEVQDNRSSRWRNRQLLNHMPVVQALPTRTSPDTAALITKGKTSGELPSVYLSNRKTTIHFKERGIFIHGTENCQLTLRQFLTVSLKLKLIRLVYSNL